MFMDTGHGDFPIRQTFVLTALLVLLLMNLLCTGAEHPWHCCFAWQSGTMTSGRSSVYSGSDCCKSAQELDTNQLLGRNREMYPWSCCRELRLEHGALQELPRIQSNVTRY